MYYIVDGILLGVLSGGFCGILIANTFDNNSNLKKFVIICATISIFSLICVFGLKSQHDNFNGGYCPRCGTKYEAIQHKNSETYYECPNCYFGTWY